MIQWFWDCIRQWPPERKSRLLQFTTGTSRVPVNGFKDLQGSDGPRRFTIEKSGDPQGLPRSHTCFNRLDLPPYEDAETMEKRLIFAIEYVSPLFDQLVAHASCDTGRLKDLDRSNLEPDGRRLCAGRDGYLVIFDCILYLCNTTHRNPSDSGEGCWRKDWGHRTIYTALSYYFYFFTVYHFVDLVLLLSLHVIRLRLEIHFLQCHLSDLKRSDQTIS